MLGWPKGSLTTGTVPLSLGLILIWPWPKKLNHGTLQRTLQERYYIYIYTGIYVYLYYNDKTKNDRLLGEYQT